MMADERRAEIEAVAEAIGRADRLAPTDREVWLEMADAAIAALDGARSPQGEDHEALLIECKASVGYSMRCRIDAALDRVRDARGDDETWHRPEQPPPDRLGGQPPAEPEEEPNADAR